MSFIIYIAFLVVTFPLRFLSAKSIRWIAKPLAELTFWLYPPYRKRALSNLALVFKEKSEKELFTLAKMSFVSSLITFLEYPKLAQVQSIQSIAFCDNPEEVAKVYAEGKGVIFFCGHQANWEILFLEGTSRMKGVAIGRPIKNRYLYKWILSIRQKFGGTIIEPKEALKKGLKALKEGKFFGIVGDQGMPDSTFSSLFLGKRCWSSPLPALLAFRTNSPISVATISREPNGRYRIHYSRLLYPAQFESAESLMNHVLDLFGSSILKKPEEWLWIHNRWKQQTRGALPKRFRFESIAIIFSSQKECYESLETFRKIYPTEFLTFFIPQQLHTLPWHTLDSDIEIQFYTSFQDLFVRDFRFKLILYFGEKNKALEKHFLHLSAFHVLHFATTEEFFHAL